MHTALNLSADVYSSQAEMHTFRKQRPKQRPRDLGHSDVSELCGSWIILNVLLKILLKIRISVVVTAKIKTQTLMGQREREKEREREGNSARYIDGAENTSVLDHK